MDIILFGAGGHAAVVIDCIQCVGAGTVTVVDDNHMTHGTIILNTVEVQPPNILETLSTRNMHCAIGDNVSRAAIFTKFSGLDYRFPIVVHPRSIVSVQSSLGRGTFVAAGCICEARSKIGTGCILNTGSIINHDCTVGDFVHIAPGSVLCGNVTVGNGTLIGANSTILPGIIIGENVTIGAGSVVTKNVAKNSKIWGIPAR